MTLTVAICTWNRSRQLRDTLECIKQLKVPDAVEWELLVVDNNSTDDTQQVLSAFKNDLPLRALFEPRQGQSFARNLAIREAHGEIIAWTDDDVCPDEHWLQATYQAFDRYNADMVFGIVHPRWLSAAPTWYEYQRFRGKFALLDYGPESFAAAHVDHTFYGANHAGRRDVFRALQGYREDLGLVGDGGGEDDTEFFTRALAAGMRIVYEPRSIIWHMIDEARCTKGYHRKRTWKSSASYFSSLQSQVNVPQVLNLPRYLFRLAFDDACGYLKTLARRDDSEHFYHELRLIQFAGVVCHALRRRLRVRAFQPSVAIKQQPAGAMTVECNTGSFAD
jgi:glycosyltransferase involved in cell wall biosynthesis